MGPEAEPTPPEDLVGRDELDEDDEMELSADDLVQDGPAGDASASGSGESPGGWSPTEVRNVPGYGSLSSRS